MTTTLTTQTNPPPVSSQVGRVALLLLPPLSWGVAVGWLTPRGPITGIDGVASVLGSLIVGALAGWAARSRWAMIIAPAAFLLAVEITRMGITGPTVDFPQVSTYGVFAFVVGRGVHGLLTLAPMMLGAAVAAGARRRTSGRERRTAGAHVAAILRRCVTAAAALSLVLLTFVVVRPGSTDQITGADGKPLPGSIAELTHVRIGTDNGAAGHDAGLLLRGRQVNAPVLLYLAGGPGGSELGAMRADASLESDFVVATWDQRGTGRSYGALDPADTLTIDSVVEDTIDVTEHLRERFGQDRVYLAGQSWGSILAVLAAQRRPDLYHAVIGIGQMVDPRKTDQLLYADTLAWARARHDSATVDELTGIGAPPYARITDYEPALAYEHDVYPYDHSENAEGEGGFSEHILAPEYAFLEKVHNLGAFLDTFSVLYPQLQNLDLRRDVPHLRVPLYVVEGGHEIPPRADLARAWFDQVTSPHKEWHVLVTSGHRPNFEQPGEFARLLRERVLRGV